MINPNVIAHTVSVAIDGSTIAATSDNYRGWCDALNCDAAGTVTMIKPNGESAVEYLVAGWNYTSARSVSAAASATNIKAGWCLR